MQQTQAKPAAAAPVISTAAGDVRGVSANNIRHFLGLPYAAAPVGENRFALPQPVAPWQGVRDASERGANAPQRLRDFPGLNVGVLVGGGGGNGDDHLTLNVLTPEGADKRPVMVFIHGGGFMAGNKDAAVQDGGTFTRDGIVYVAINYRLGIDGFLPIPGVPTNLGLHDMIAALRWVQANIAAFGGDPANVTVFGESAGAMAIADLVASPLAEGLFRRAIVESGHGSMVRDISIAQRFVRKLAKLLKITPDAAGFRSVDFDTGMDAVEKLAKPGKVDLRDDAGFEPVFGISRFIPVYGDDVLPAHPLKALAKGAGKDVQLLIGSNRDEMNLYFVPTGVQKKMIGILARIFVGKHMPRAGKALKAYGLGKKKAGVVMCDALSDLVFRWPARQFAAAHQGRTHMYEFDWRSPACDGLLGAAHGMELPFVFDSLSVATGADGIVGTNPPQALADHVHRLWVQFATDGRLPWQEYDGETRQVYQLAAGKAVNEPVMPAAAFLP